MKYKFIYLVIAIFFSFLIIGIKMPEITCSKNFTELRKFSGKPFMQWFRSTEIYKWYAMRKWNSKNDINYTNHFIKQYIVKKYQGKYNVNVLVETGTYLGDMVYAQKDAFKKIISIELGESLANFCKRRFKKYNHIEILQGDSAKVIKEVVPKLTEKTLFWLDSHYFGGISAKGDLVCPIYDELEAVFSNDLNHIILIDDAGCFKNDSDYPSLDEVERFIKSKNSNYKIEVKHNMIIATID